MMQKHEHLRNLPRRVAIIVLLSVALSIAITVSMSAAFGSAVSLMALAIAVLCPLVVATPVSWVFLRQSDRLETVHAELRSAHARLTEMHGALEKKSRLDHMTGLFNRETFLQTIAPGNRKTDSGFLFIIDADHFKHINDSHGHQTGDRALTMMAKSIASCIREGDTAARIGGEEFAVFLPGASLAEAIAVSERIRQAIEHLEFKTNDGEVIPLTVSMGGAEFIQNGPLDGVLGKADRMLYEAKSSGRNRAVVVPELARVA